MADGVTSIGEYAFLQCRSLTSATIPGSVVSIGEYAFDNCISLTSVTIPASITSIGVYAFDNCTSLTNVTISNGVTSMTWERAFWECPMTSVTIPASVTNIVNGLFAACNSLTAIIVDARNSFYSSVNGILFDESQTTLIQYPPGLRGSYTIPSSVTNIGDEAFFDCIRLASVTIPGSVINIGDSAFQACYGLASVTIPGSVTSIGNSAFAGCFALTSVYFEGNAPTSGSSEFIDDNNVTGFYLPGTTGWNAFSTNTGLTVVLWNPLIQASGTNFGMQNNQFGFNITGTNNFTVVVEACTNLTCPVWIPLQTNTLTNGSFYFSDPRWTNYPCRYYGLGLP
jgi:hypothetical protein